MKNVRSGPLRPPAGFVLAFVERPPQWVPTSPTAVPPVARIVEKQQASSYDAAYADMVRSNRAAMNTRQGLWAMVLRANAN